MNCPVCSYSGSNIAPHYGGKCCRACAAFFRRYFHSTKFEIRCKCGDLKNTTHPCRKCRMDKCLENGMKFSKVQGLRDPITILIHPSSPPSILSRSSPRLDANLENFIQVEMDRFNLYNTAPNVSVFEVTSNTEPDIDLTLSFLQKNVPEFKQLSFSDKKHLVNNVFSKWWLFGTVLEMLKAEAWEYESGSDKTKMEILQFYQCDNISDNDIIQLFEPYWSYYFHRFVSPIVHFNFDKSENFGIFLLLLFDPAYINLSDNCVELCHNMRKVILQELRGYQMEKDHEDTRICDIFEAIGLIERVDEQFREEILFCDLNGVKLDDEFRRLLCKNNI